MKSLIEYAGLGKNKAPTLQGPLYEESGDSIPANGSLNGRHVIAQDTLINGGMYLGAAGREIIIVDDSRDQRRYDQVYNSALKGIYETAEAEPDFGVLSKVLIPTYTAVRRAIPYNEVGVDQLTLGYPNYRMDLAKFIMRRTGIVRHQALLTGYILERMIDEGELMSEDNVSIDRSVSSDGGGHAWVRYTASDGSPYIIDPALSLVRSYGQTTDAPWEYGRPDELDANQ
jgi:hypothetical protein